jgi:multidrug resistance efflux pump
MPSATPGQRPADGPGRGELVNRVQSLRLGRDVSVRSKAGGRIAWFLVVLLTAATLGLLYERGFAPPGQIGRKSTTKSITGGTDAKATANSRDPSKGTSGAGASVRDAPDSNAIASTGSSASRGRILLESKGYVIPEQQILVSPKVSGMVLELNVVEGRRVNEGDVLAVLESVEYEQDVRRYQALLAVSRQRLAELKTPFREEEITQARAEWQEAEAALEQMVNDFQRAKKLKSTISKAEFEAAESAFEKQVQRVAKLKAAYELATKPARIERIELAQAEVDQAQAELDKAEWRLSNCTIRAPISGTILKKNAEKGNIINPAAFNGSFSLCDLADLSKLEVELNIQERDISLVTPGQLCTVTTDAYPKIRYRGVVSRLMPVANRAEGAIPVRVRLTIPPGDEGKHLKPEMSATVQFLNEQATEKPTTEAASR